MIECTLNGKDCHVHHTFPNNSGQISTFMHRGKGNVSARSFNKRDFNTVEEFLKSEYPNIKI